MRNESPIVPCLWFDDQAEAAAGFRFGLSWQVVPDSIAAWLTGGDAAARDRAFRAMLGMKKLEVAALEAAFRGA